jgi:hypothetical protein
VILCTGAGAFKPNGFPVCDLTHDGTIMAYNIGAKVRANGMTGTWSGEEPCCHLRWLGDMFDQRPSTEGVGVRHDWASSGILAYAGFSDRNGSGIEHRRRAIQAGGVRRCTAA